MLIIEIVLDVAAGEGFGGLVVVFDVIGAQALVGVMDIDIVVGDEEIALAALGTFGGKFGDAAFGLGRAALLGHGTGGARENHGKREQRQGQEGLERGEFPSMRVASHATEAINRVSWIA